VPRHEFPPRGRTWLECCTGALILATRISKGQGIAGIFISCVPGGALVRGASQSRLRRGGGGRFVASALDPAAPPRLRGRPWPPDSARARVDRGRAPRGWASSRAF